MSKQKKVQELMVAINVMLSPELIRKLDEVRQGVSRSKLIREALDEYLKRL